jgi:hypothetical protein
MPRGPQGEKRPADVIGAAVSRQDRIDIFSAPGVGRPCYRFTRPREMPTPTP